MAKESGAEACPVDSATREEWLKKNPKKGIFPGATSKASAASNRNSSAEQNESSTQRSWWSRLLFTSPTPASSNGSKASERLGEAREVSTIPRASLVSSSGANPANSEAESGVSSNGNWVYPSEKMFFEAMKRKGHAGEAADMKTIVPIHNAVNERAWKEIKEWERPWGSYEKCGGPKLDSFLGLKKSLSPKARLNTWLGYTAPFDRHDWVIDRCGTKVEYIIDFYSGRSDGKGNGKLNFFLDVRPKLNTWEGWKMRASKTFGLV